MIPTTEHAYAAVAEAFDVPTRHLYGQCRRARFARPRFAAWLIARELLCLSYPAIGRHAGRDHASITHGCKRAMELIETDPEFAEAFRAAHDATNHARTATPVFRTRRAA